MRGYCVDTFGGHLASIHSEQGQANAVAECTEATKDGPESLNKQCWIGMSDIDVEGTFVWSDASPVDYRNFVEGEPNDCRWTGSACDGDPNTYPGECAFQSQIGCVRKGSVPCLLHTISCPSEQDAVLLWHRGDNAIGTSGLERRARHTAQGVRLRGVDADWTSEAPTCVYGSAVSLSGLTLDEVYQPNQDYYVQMAMTGTHIFTAMAEWGYGWHDGWWGSHATIQMPPSPAAQPREQSMQTRASGWSWCLQMSTP